ncbi:MAG: PAS domain-containing protein [Pirellulaceae bacterium]|nr:PAS domain-containing protein [Pirellulaceae bacterium]
MSQNLNLERNETQAELHEANELRTQLLVRTANVGLWDWDLVSNRVYFSPEWKMQLGYAEDELTNRYEEWESRLHPDDRESALTAVREFREGIRSVYDVEFRLQHKDGSWRWICARADFQRDATGKAIRIMGCHLDITDRKIADAARSEALQRLEKITSRIPGVVYQFRMRPDGSSCFPYASEGMRVLLGVGPEEVREDGHKLFAYHHPDDEPALFASIEKSKNELSPWSHEFRFRFPDGSVRWISGNSIPEREPDGSTLWHGYMADVTERKQTEEALERSRADLNEAQRVALMGSWHLDVASNKVQWSDELYRMLGFDPKQPPPPFTTHEKLFTKESWEKLSAAITKTLNTGVPYELELEMVRQDGSHGWMWVRGVAAQDENGVTVSLRGVAQDITERKRTEAALKDSEGRWRFALEGGRDGVWEWNVVDNTVLHSKRCLEILGFEEGDIGENADDWRELVHPEDLAQVTNHIWAHLEGKTPYYKYEHRIKCKDGSYKWIDARGLVISRDNNGKPLRLIGTHADVTERKQAEALLRDNQALENSAAGLRLVTTSARVGLVVVSREHRYTFANAAYSAIFNLPQDLVGKHIGEVLPELYEKRVRPRLDRAFSGERMDYEIRLNTSTTPIHCAVNYEPVMEGNVVTSVAIVVMDITAQRNTEEQLRQSQKMEAVGQLAGGIAHDFNNLLTIISGYTNLLLKKLAPPDPAWNFLNEIRTASKRAAELTSSLLAFSHQQIRTPELVNVNEVVVETLKLLERAIGERVEISVSLEPELKNVWMDRSEVSQILLNLSINARDAMQDEGTLTIQTQNVTVRAGEFFGEPKVAPGDYVLLTVSDSGGGMSEEVQRRIFEPFFTTKPVGKGTGLGLAMVHGIVTRSGGGIRVASTMGKGSAFSIYLPQSSQSTDSNQDAAFQRDLNTKLQGGSETILLVEDDDTVRGLTRTILRHFGYTVIEAGSGQAALEIFTQNRGQIQLVITDVVMPGMNGAVLVEHIQKVAPGVPVLMISGYVGETATREKLLDAKVNFLQKPFEPNAFAQKVRELLDQSPSNLR